MEVVIVSAFWGIHDVMSVRPCAARQGRNRNVWIGIASQGEWNGRSLDKRIYKFHWRTANQLSPGRAQNWLAWQANPNPRCLRYTANGRQIARDRL